MRSLLITGWSILAIAGCGDVDGTSKKGESCAKSGDCIAGLKCVAQICAPDLPAGFCQKLADLCDPYLASRGKSPVDVTRCVNDCEKGDKTARDDCWAPACSVEVGLCDNQEPGDVKILQCADNHGWQ